MKKIKFLQTSNQAILDDLKTQTTRLKKTETCKYKVGDICLVERIKTKILIKSVKERNLLDMGINDLKRENCFDLQHFLDSWNIWNYPEVTDENPLVWEIQFERVQ